MSEPAFRLKYRVKSFKADYVRRALASASAAYEGASTSARLTNWRINTGGPNTVIGSSLSTLRSRSRDVRRKNGLADAGLEVLVSNWIGTGIKPQFKTKDAGLNKELAALWLKWTDESDADGRFDFYGQQALACSSMLEAGDVFGRLRVRRASDGLTVPLQIQLLESEFCPVEKTETFSANRIIQNGVEFNGIGQRVAYWMYRDHPNDMLVRPGGNFEPVPVPASEIVHLANVKRPGMVRGEPWLSRALVKMFTLDQYDDAQLVRQNIAAMFAGFVTPSADSKFETEGGDDTPDSNGILSASLEPGTVQKLGPGESITFPDVPDPGQTYDVFNVNQHRYIATALGILYEQLTGDFSKVNDRTWRAAMNEFKRKLARWQHSIMVFQFCRPIMQRWSELAVLSNAIRLPRGIEVSDVAMPKWLPQAHEYINPVQDVQARRDEVRAGFRSRAEIVSERGYDVEEVDTEIAADNKRADGLALRYDSDGRTDLKGGNPEEDAPETQGAFDAGNNPRQ
jgi:lambda family phage portal protein